MRLQFSCNLLIFLLDVFKIEVCAGPIKSIWLQHVAVIAVELTNSSTTQNHMVFQPTSEQTKYGASDILKKLQFSFEVNN